MIYWSPEVAIWLALVTIGLTFNVLSHREISSNQRARKAGPLPPDLKQAALEILATDRIDEVGRSIALLLGVAVGVIALLFAQPTPPETPPRPEGEALAVLLLAMVASLDTSAGLCWWRNHRRSRRLISAAESKLSSALRDVSEAREAVHVAQDALHDAKERRGEAEAAHDSSEAEP